MSSSGTLDRQQALEELDNNYVELAVKLDPDQVAWDPDDTEPPRVEPTTPPAEGVAPPAHARVMVHTFTSPNAKKVSDLAPAQETAEGDIYMSAVGLYFNLMKAYHCVHHGVKPKDLTKVKQGGKLDPSLNLLLTSADPAVVMYWEIISLPRETLRPGQLFKSVPDDKILRHWSFAKSGGQPTTTPELSCVPLDIATKLNYFAGQQLKTYMKGKMNQFDNNLRNEFNQNEVTHISDYKRILPSMFTNKTVEFNSATAKNLGIAHPEIFFNPESPPFQSLQADSFTCKDKAAERHRENIVRAVTDVRNYIYHKERVFLPVNPAPFCKISDKYLKGMGQMSAAIKDCATAHCQREDSPRSIFCTEVTVKLAASEPNMALLVDVLDKFKFVEEEQQDVFYTKDNHWLILRPSLRTDKRKCCKMRGNSNQVLRLFDLIIDAGEQSLHIADAPVFFHRCHDFNIFLQKVSEWNGEHDNIPLAVFEVGEDGRFVDFSTSADVGDAGASQPLWANGVVVLLPDHCCWQNRDKLKEAQKILARSNVFPKAFFIEDVLQSGRCRNDIARELRREEDRHRAARRARERQRRRRGSAEGSTPLHASNLNTDDDFGMPRPSLSLENPPPIQSDAKVVTYAMHFACPNKSQRAHMKKLKSKLKSFMIQDDSEVKDTRVPVFFERLSQSVEQPDLGGDNNTFHLSKVLGGDNNAFHFSKSVLDCKDRNEAQRIFVEQSTHKKVSLLSCGPDDTRNEEQQSTVAELAADVA